MELKGDSHHVESKKKKKIKHQASSIKHQASSNDITTKRATKIK
jgi:hypothetical protein